MQPQAVSLFSLSHSTLTGSYYCVHVMILPKNTTRRPQLFSGGRKSRQIKRDLRIYGAMHVHDAPAVAEEMFSIK